MNNPDPKWIKVSISESLHNRLMAFCIHKGRKSYLVRRAIKELVERMERDQKQENQETKVIFPSLPH